MLEKIQKKIESLNAGAKLILGAGIQETEMQKVVSLCETLQSDGVIKIVNAQPATIMIQKI
jgi:hypothetical protein